MHSTQWNQDIQERSYLTYTCGEGPGIACPGSSVPHPRNDNRGGGANTDGFGINDPPDFPYRRN